MKHKNLLKYRHYLLSCYSLLLASLFMYNPGFCQEKQDISIKKALINEGFLVAQKVILDKKSRIAAVEIGIIDADPGQVQIAIFSDQNGVAHQILEQGEITNLQPGKNEMPLKKPLKLSAGEYWIAFSFNQATFISIEQAEQNAANYTFHNFGKALPNYFQGVSYGIDKCQVSLK